MRPAGGQPIVRLRAEESLVLSCVRAYVSKRTPAADLAALSGFDWRRALDLAGAQGVLGSFLAALGPDGLPEELRPVAAAQRQALARESLRLTGALIDLVQRFQSSGIEMLPFKGPTLARQAYGDVGLRWFADLDLLVRPADLAPARELLLELDFVPSYPTTPARRQLLERWGSHESFERSDHTWVELHWRLAAPLSEFGVDYDRLWRRLGTVRLAGYDLPALRTDDLLLVLALHGAKHAWERLGWICDVAMLIGAEPTLDWDALVTEAERMRARRVLLLALRLASGLLGAELPLDLADAARTDPAVARLAARVERDLFRPPRSGAGTLGFHLDTRAGWRDKLALLGGALTALNQRDLEVVALPDTALPLYYLTRPARLALKAVGHALGRGRP
jgi:hypothetical protein